MPYVTTVVFNLFRDYLFLFRFVQRDTIVTTAMLLWFSTKTAPVPQGIFVLVEPLMHMSSPVPWGHLATLLVSLESLNAVHVLVATTVTN